MWDRIRRNYRRLVAFMLIVVMVATNMGGNLSTVFAAGESESALFLVDGAELRRAIQEAEEQGEVFKFSSLQLAASKKSIKNKYEKLLGTKEGKVYELDLDIDSSYAPEGTAVQVFYNAGTKDVVFLFQNESEMVVDYRINIDGYEIEEVTVNPNTNNIEDEDASFAEDYQASDMINDVKDKPKAEIVDSKETTAADEDAAKESTDEAEEDTDEAGDVNESEEGTEDSEESSEADASEEESTEAETEDSDDADAEEESTEAETEAEDETEAEPEEEAEPETEEDREDSADGELLSLSHHEAVVVAISLDDLDQDSDSELAEETEEVTEEDSEEEEEETEAETEEETEEETDSETEAGETEETDESEAEDEDIKEETQETDASESEEDPEEETSTESGSIADDEEDSKDVDIDDTAGVDSDIEEDAGDGSDEKFDKIEMEGQALEDDEIEFLGKLEAKSLDTVTILDNINAKAVKIAWEDIEAIITEEEAATDCLVEYSVNLPDGATVKGADSVAQGENLYFAVEVAEDYEILAVYADGQELDALEEEVSQASAASWKAGSYVYLVEGVESDLSVEVEVEEVRTVIPAGVYTAEAEDAVFTVNVPEDAFEEEVEFRATKISDEAVLEELASQADEAVGESRTVAGILAYDLAFFTASDVEVEPGKPVSVSMSFKEDAALQEISEDASGISVVHFPEGEEAKTVTAVEETSVEELEFEAESFSMWAAVATKEANVNHEGWIVVENLKELHAVLGSITGNTEKIKVYLNSDIETTLDQSRPEDGDHGWKIPEGADVVIDLNGKTLTYGGVGKEGRYLFKVEGTLTIMDSSSDHSGIINHNRDIDTSIYVTGNGTLNLEGGTITAGEGHTNKHGIEINSNAVFNMTGGSIKGNKHGVEINSFFAVFNMTGGSIEENGNLEEDGGGIYLIKGTVNINGGSIKGNIAKNGGGIRVESGPVTINGGSIEENTAEMDGGGISLGVGELWKGSLTFNSGEIKNNIAKKSGGGVYTYPGSSTVIGGGAEIIGNKSEKVEPKEADDSEEYRAGSGGGGIFSNGNLQIKGGKISQNTAKSDGGGVYVDFKSWNQSGMASFLMTYGEISNNLAETGEGGGIYFGGDGTIEGGSIFENETQTEFDWGGGGVFIQTGVNVKMKNALITQNHADGFGGGVAGCPSGVIEIFTIDGAAIYANDADGTGITKRTDADRKTDDRTAQEEWSLLGDYKDYQDYYCQNESVVYGKMLGGGSANWKGSRNQKISDSEHTETELITIGRYENKTATYRMALSANPDESGKAHAESNAHVKIYGNKSSTHGGGIMSNGHLELGEAGPEPGHLEISKTVIGSEEAQANGEWNFRLSLSDSNGNPFTADSGVADAVDDGMQQGSIGFVMKNEETGEMELGSLALENGQTMFALKHNQKIIFENLPEGIVYHVEEIEANQDGFVTLVKGSADSIAIEDTTDATKVIGAEGHVPAQGETAAVDFINMKSGELSVSKTVMGETNIQDWTFVLTLLDADGNPLKNLPKVVDPVDGSMQADALAFELNTLTETEEGSTTTTTTGSVPMSENGEIMFVLRHGQTITIKGIPAETRYQVVEQDANKNGLVAKVNGSEGSTEIRDEEDPEKLVGLQGTIVNGETANARFVNAQLGALAVSKTVVGDKAAESQEWEFELTLLQESQQDPNKKEALQVFTGTEADLDGAMQYGVLPYEITGNGMEPEKGSLALDEDGKAKFALKHGQTITVKDIPAGTAYTVSEVKANQDGFITNVIGKGEAAYIVDEANEGKIKGTEGTILNDQVTMASFINTKADVLTVSKIVKGDESFNDYEWLFTLQLFDKDGNKFGGTEVDSEDIDSGMQAPSIAYTGGSLIAGVEAPQDGVVSLEGGKTQFVLKHGQFITLIDLPVGTKYTITEDEANTHGFYASVSGSEGSTSVTDEENSRRVTGLSGTIESGKPGNADFINQKGRLIVKKIVRGNKADMTKEFPFTVTLDDNVINGKYGDMDFANGVATFKLKGGDSAEATDLPVGIGYSVKESDNEDYNVEYSNASGTITADGVTVTCINTKNGDDTPDGDNPGGNNPGGGGSGGGNSSGGNSPTTDIGDREVPLANFPDAPTETIVESEVPLVPLPKTGDSRHKGLMLMLFGMAGFGAIFAAASLKKNKEED